MFCVKIVAFLTVSGDNYDYVNMRIVKIIMDTNGYHFLLFLELNNIQKPCLSHKSHVLRNFIGNFHNDCFAQCHMSYANIAEPDYYIKTQAYHTSKTGS